MGKQIIIRADDLGYCEAVNLGIIKTVKDGIINNIGLMVNMPTSVAGLSALQQLDKPVDIGLHTVICTGRPVSDPSQLPSLTTPDGQFKASSVYRQATHDFVNLDEAIVEIEAQYQRFVTLVGRQPDYFEGHAVVSDNFVKALRIVAERHQLRFLEYHFDGAPTPLNGKQLYVEMDSMKPDYHPFKTLQKTVNTSHSDGLEVMVCHPGYLDEFILTHSSLTIPRTQEVTMLCDEKTKRWLAEQNVELLRYSDL